ncbi:cell division protein FtsK [Listeria booriae]|nr:cell division protein FtsK [Listeria booriae]
MSLLIKETIQMLVFQWLIPMAIMAAIYRVMYQFIYNRYERMDMDRLWGKLILSAVILGTAIGLWLYLSSTSWFMALTGYSHQGIHWFTQTGVAQVAAEQGRSLWNIIFTFILTWVPIYFRAFVLVWVTASLLVIRSIVWRVHITRTTSILVSTAVCFPYLCLKYIFGYQTPIFDFLQARLFVAKLKENVNDSYFNALQGVDEKGEKFEGGSGGSAQIQRIKAATIAIRQTKAKIRTAGGLRRAEIVVRHSRETDTDKVIESALNGVGKRIIAPSIRFQDNPVLNVSQGGYVLDSDVIYRAGDELGRWRAIFSNPWAKEQRVKNGGDGSLRAFVQVIRDVFRYVSHITPPAIYDQIIEREKRLYTPDTTADKAKYTAQQNLDLSVVPEPNDPATGNDIPTQTKIARRVAEERIPNVTNALNAFKVNGVFDQVQVGGNSAIYRYTLPRTADLPTDFNRLQEGLERMLKTTDTPIITISANMLSVSLINGVTIPVDFRQMILQREKGLPSIITGIFGVDAMGNNVYGSLGDIIPHLMLFGATGQGKTVTIMAFLYSVMSAVDPTKLKIAYIDGKGNSFEFMRTDNSDSETYHPNPFTYAQPADASGDIEYGRGLLKYMEMETRRRIELFKKSGVSKLEGYNKKFPDKYLYEILVVVDEFSAITDLDDKLKASEVAEKGTIDTLEYLAKMGRSAGIHLLPANQTARKEKVPGKISANIGGRVSLGVSEPIESDIALPDSNIAVHLIKQPGEFYSNLNGIRNAEHGFTPYLSDDTMNALNDSLEKKFGHHDYVVTREEVMMAVYGEEDEAMFDIPEPMPTRDTPLEELLELMEAYPHWAIANKSSTVIARNKEVTTADAGERRKNKLAIKGALTKCQEDIESVA